MSEFRHGLENRGRQFLAAGIAAIGAISFTGCESSQIKASLEHCQEQTSVEQCLGQLAALRDVTQPIMSENAFRRVVEINTTYAPSDQSLHKLRMCESTNNYQVVNKSGKYMGAYQFDQRTWNGAAAGAGLSEFVGVKPNKAPAGVQDAVTRELFKHRGRKPWPKCGKRI